MEQMKELLEKQVNQIHQNVDKMTRFSKVYWGQVNLFNSDLNQLNSIVETNLKVVETLNDAYKNNSMNLLNLFFKS